MKAINMVGNIVGGIVNFVARGFLYLFIGAALGAIGLVIVLWAIVITAF